MGVAALLTWTVRDELIMILKIKRFLAPVGELLTRLFFLFVFFSVIPRRQFEL